ncbi:sensor histidine kinase [Paenibacillus glucanolyticus]|uniref:histidine kinase n=1 Tax=Paenibacillus glucanolyticus TaxID=59843 RepID=A0A163IDX6_9BACL|nr:MULTISPECIES: HAMP domain-containing sensor histidine kinase [Paenibacillus]AWP30621.1 sensor histidine kinase [Paenibacillus sp. Cedars]KZS45920.1 two-component sensor histidine kinase [Paenibacillus glucanolyticus]
MRKLQWKIIMLFLVSGGLTLIMLFIAQQIIRLIGRDYWREPMVAALFSVDRLLENFFGFPIVATMVGIVLFICIVLLLSQGTIRQINQLMEGTKRLAKGELDQEILIRSNDELGQMAKQINQMAKQLKLSLAEERMAVQSKNELISNVSHDLRTPLTSIIGYLRLVKEDRYKDEVELRYYTDIAYDKSLRLGGLVSDLFEYTRMGYSPINRVDINLVELLGQLAVDFSLTGQHEKVQVVFTPATEKIMISSDGDKLMRTFENLLSNAVRHGRDAGRVDLKVSREPKVAIVQVINYGPPIPQHAIPHLFERFYRADESRTDQTGGSGLGLAIVKTIVDAHHGTIQVTSSTELTMFEVRLPLQAPEINK